MRQGRRLAAWVLATCEGLGACGGGHRAETAAAVDATPSDTTPDVASETGGADVEAPHDGPHDATSNPDTVRADAATSDAATSPPLEPLQLAFTWHLEGAQLVSDRAAFDRYIREIRTLSDLFAEYGAVPTWDAAEIVARSIAFNVNILQELEARGDVIGLHANGVGYVPSDPDYTLDDMVAELNRQAARIRSLGVTVRHVSNICSTVDWVQASREAGFQAATAMVDYCLKSLSEPGDASDCANPSQCHDAWPGTLEGQMSAWHARSGADWTTPAADGLLLIPTSGAINCASEAAAGTVSPTHCAYDDDDATAVLAEIEATVDARKPGKRHSFVMVASWGTRPDQAVFRTLFEGIRTRWVATGKARWVGFDALIDALHAAPPLP